MSEDVAFWNGLRASLVFIALAVPFRVGGALALAPLLRRRGPLVGLGRAAVYLPTVVPDVAYALPWLYIFDPFFGPLNGILSFLTGNSAAGWLLTGATAHVAIALMLTWPIGEGFVLMLAALQDIPSELEEAAVTDGAERWQHLWKLTLPLLAPYLLLLTIPDTVWSFQANFEAAVIVTGGGPYYATSYLPYWIYLSASEFQHFVYAAAMTLVMHVVTAGVVAVQFGVARRWRSAYFA
jgi:multiple sugar transport system permease protein